MTGNLTYVNISQIFPPIVPYLPLVSIFTPIVLGGFGGFISSMVSFLKERKEAREKYKEITFRQYSHEIWICIVIGAFAAILLATQPSPIQEYIEQYPMVAEVIIGYGSVSIFDRWIP